MPWKLHYLPSATLSNYLTLTFLYFHDIHLSYLPGTLALPALLTWCSLKLLTWRSLALLTWQKKKKKKSLIYVDIVGKCSYMLTKLQNDAVG